MIKVLVVDDEIYSRTTLISFLKNFSSNVDLIGEASGVAEAEHAIMERKPDVVLLDINMNDGTGFDLLDRLPEINFNVIFTTAYDEYALKAFKYSAVDYLLKPIDPEELNNALKKAAERMHTDAETGKQLIDGLKENIRKPNELKIAISDKKSVSYVIISEIVYMLSNNNYTVFSLKNKEQIVASKTLKEYEELLEGEGFFRIHNTCLINLNHVIRYIKGEGGSVVLSDGSEHEVSRRKKAEFLEALEKYQK